MTQEAQTVQTTQEAPSVAPAGTDLQGSPAPEGVLPMLDRTQFQEPEQGAPVGDALLEGEPQDVAPEQTPDQQPEPDSFESETLQDMIGGELMQDPGASLVANSLIRMMQGADHNRAFAKAIEHGDARFIDTAYLEEKLGPDLAQEAIKAAEYLVGYADRYVEDLKQRLFSTVPGGEQALQLAAKHFRTAAPAEEHKAVARMLDSGDLEIMQYAVRQIMRYGSDLPQGAVAPQPRHTVAPTGLQPLSRAEFGKAVLDNPNMSEQEYNQLSARLQASMQQRR